MRAFIAIELPKGIKEEIRRFQKEISNLFIAKWIASFHLTFKFLGEIDENQSEKIKTILKDICSKNKSFKISIKGVGAFPSEEYIRVLWLGIENGDKGSRELQKQIEKGLNSIGFAKEEREYKNHVTIGRIKKITDKTKLKELFEKYKNKEFGEFEADSIKLIKSTLTPDGPIYEVLNEFNLPD